VIHSDKALSDTFGYLRISTSLYVDEKRPIYIKRDLYTSKETYVHEKTPIYIKRDLYTSKETYTLKETYIRTLKEYIKRDLYTSKYIRIPSDIGYLRI